jgi:hypothetical protein
MTSVFNEMGFSFRQGKRFICEEAGGGDEGQGTSQGREARRRVASDHRSPPAFQISTD